MNKEDIIATLQKNAPALRAKGVLHAALFGSRARGDNREDSDIDILVELDPDMLLGVWEYAGIKREVADLFSAHVDVVSRGGLKPYIQQEVLHDAIQIF
jgi:uncharacterized protein